MALFVLLFYNSMPHNIIFVKISEIIYILAFISVFVHNNVCSIIL